MVKVGESDEKIGVMGPKVYLYSEPNKIQTAGVKIRAYDKFWLTYFGKRNLVWLGRKYSTSKFNFWKGFIISLPRSIVGIILFDDHKFKRINFIINAYFDGLRGNFDNFKPKKLLYRR